MASLDLAITPHKLLTDFFPGYVQHTTFHSDSSQGRRRVEVVKKWNRRRELGRGNFGTVFLEESEGGEHRAVKEIAKGGNSRIDYRRELTAMAVLAGARDHDALFVQFLGWYESNDYIHIAMEYISHGHLRQYLEAEYLEVESPESEAKAITRQLLEGLLVIHQEGFAHRDLKPENIFVVSTSPIWVKIGDFGLAKLAGDGTAFRTEGGTWNYIAPEVRADDRRETSEYTNAVDIWALGCITYELLTQTLPFRGFGELNAYCSSPQLLVPRNTMRSKGVSDGGIEFVEKALAYPPEHRITAGGALVLEWLRAEGRGVAGMETEDWSGGGLSAPVWGREMDTLVSSSVADNDYELQSSLREGQALSEKVAMGLIRNLNQYLLADCEKPINGGITKGVASRVTAKSDTTLLQVVDMDDSGPYEIAEPRAIPAFGGYIPLYLEANRLVDRLVDRLRPVVVADVSVQAQAQAEAERMVMGDFEAGGDINPVSLLAELEPVHEPTKTEKTRSCSCDEPSDRMVPFIVSGKLFTIPNSQIQQYPYSKLADLAAASLRDEVVAIKLPLDLFSLLVHYLEKKSLPSPLPDPQTLSQISRVLGIPFPTPPLLGDHYEASMGSSGSLREFSQRSNPHSTPDVYTPDLRSSLARMERGLLTTLDVVHAGESDGLQEYGHSESHPRAPAVADGMHVSLFDACSEVLGWEKPLAVVFTAGLEPIALQPWDAAPDEQILSYPGIPTARKKIVRISAESSYAEVQELREKLLGALGDGIVFDVQENEEVSIRFTSPMGLLQCKTTRGVVVRIYATKHIHIASRLEPAPRTAKRIVGALKRSNLWRQRTPRDLK